MFNLENAINKWKHFLRKNPGFEDGDITELESHLRDEIDQLMSKGLSKEKAFVQACSKIGDSERIGIELYKNRTHGFDVTPYWQQSSGISALLPNYLKVVWRNLISKKGYSFINIVGLSVGLAACLLIALYVQYEWSYDSFHQKADRTYRVLREFDLPDLQTTITTTPPGLAAAVRQNFPAVEKAIRVQKASLTVEYGNNKFIESSFLDTEDGFFDVFSFPVIEGTATLHQPHTVLITKRIVPKYFGNENPIGKTLKVAGTELEITGILANPPENTHLQFDFIASLWEPDQSWGRNNYTTYLLLREGTNTQTVTTQLADLITKNIEPEGGRPGSSFIPHLQPVTGIHLGQGVSLEIESTGNIQYLYLFIGLAIFIVILACINFMNLATARSMERAREVGLRKTLGGNRIQIAFQFLGESLLMAFLASLLAILFFKLCLPYLNNIAGTSIVFVQLFAGQSLGLFTVLTLATGLTAGIYPAFVLSHFQPSRVLKGAFGASQNSALRRGLVVFQFTISIALLAGTGIIHKQIQFMKSSGLGFNPDNVVLVSQAQFLGQDRTAFMTELSKIPGVEIVTSGFSVPGTFFINSMWQPDTPEADAHNMDYSFVDFDYVKTLNLEIIAGRSFSHSFERDTFSVILNETAVKDFGWTLDEAIDHKLVQGQSEFDIIGVVKDFNYRSLHSEIYPLALFGPRRFPRFIAVRVTPEANLLQIIKNIQIDWEQFSSLPFEYSFLADDLKAQYKTEEQLIKVFGTFAALAIFIGCLGLFGLSAFMVAQRTKEIGIRKVLGATTIQIVKLVSTDLLKLVSAGLIFAIPLTWYFMNLWLQDFAYKTKIDIWVFAITGFMAFTIALLTVSGQAVRAANMNPIQSLKNE